MQYNEIKDLSTDDLFKKLSSSASGLSSEMIPQRLQQYGPNEITEKHVNPVVKVLKYFWGPIPWMIEAAIILSAIINHWDDFFIISLLLIINVVVGFLQENKADNAIEMLKKKLALNARVLRDSAWTQILARDLVPGDVVRVRLGDIVPADIKLFNGEYLQVDESALTGESLPVEKHVSDIAFGESIVKQGEMDGVVVSTGKESYFGKTTALVAEAKSRSHFQKAVIKIGDYLIAIAIILVSIVSLTSLFRHEPLLNTFQFALVLVVAAIPVALPAVLTVTMTVGAIALAKKEAIVSKLTSIEEMAGIDVLCADKTGTITKNELSVKEVKPFNGFAEEDLLVFGALASRKEDQDPIDDTILKAGSKNTNVQEKIHTFSVSDFKPFDPVHKRNEATIMDTTGKKFMVAKGAPQVILDMVSDKEKIQATMEKTIDEFASKGYRSLAISRTNGSEVWEFMGLFAIYDPPRDDSKDTIQNAQSMGVTVKMVTGDHIAIAKEIAREVHLGTNIILPSAFLDTSEKSSKKAIEEADGFAQVFPEHKYQIVERLQEMNHIVGMTGDGVNDAPALKKADAGVAVAGSTDAAKSAADIVITRPGLSVIIDALRESRKIFQRMNNYAIYRIAETLRVLLLVSLTILIFDFFPVTAVMIVLLAMLNDLPIMTIAYDHVKIHETAVRWNMREVLSIASLLGTTGLFFSFGLFLIGFQVFRLDLNTLQTLIFLKLAIAGHMTIYLARTGKYHFWVRPLPAPILFFTAETTQFFGTLVAVYGIFMPPLGWSLAGFIWGYALIEFVVTDFIKIKVYSLANHTDITFHHQRMGANT
jgi:H+-transporting ATPase